MDDFDFLNALTDKEFKRKAVAEEVFGKQKTSGIMDLVKGKAPEIGAALAGAGLASGAQYLMNRKPPGGKSVEQRAATAFLASSEAVKDQAERDNRPLTFREDMTDAIAPSSKRMADVLARHPVKGAVLVAPVGALAGLRILKALK